MIHLFLKTFCFFRALSHQPPKKLKKQKIIISTLLTLTFPLPYMSSKCYINNQPSERSKWSSQFFLLTFKMTSPIPPKVQFFSIRNLCYPTFLHIQLSNCPCPPLLMYYYNLSFYCAFLEGSNHLHRKTRIKFKSNQNSTRNNDYRKYFRFYTLELMR